MCFAMYRPFRLVIALGLSTALSLPVQAETTAGRSDVVAAYGDAALTTRELAAEVEALSAKSRERFAASPKARNTLVKELLLRRLIAERARQEGIADDPDIRHRLRLLEERLLFEVYLQRAEAAALDEAAIEKMAHDEYRAYRDKFVTPEAVRASHILVRFGANAERDRAQAEVRLRELLARLRSGEDFAKLAREYSEDPGSARNGGDLGLFEKGRMAKPFEEAAFGLREPGDLSDIVETQFGLHIIRLTERREAGQRSFDEVRDGLIAKNRERARQSIRKDTLEPLSDPQGFTIDEAALEALFSAD
jgi:peptidyl-prolyl cis-trans isomerase C